MHQLYYRGQFLQGDQDHIKFVQTQPPQKRQHGQDTAIEHPWKRYLKTVKRGTDPTLASQGSESRPTNETTANPTDSSSYTGKGRIKGWLEGLESMTGEQIIGEHEPQPPPTMPECRGRAESEPKLESSPVIQDYQKTCSDVAEVPEVLESPFDQGMVDDLAVGGYSAFMDQVETYANEQ